MLDYWFLTPICLVGATVAMSSGVGGPLFFTPLFILVLQLPPATAVAVALCTQLFGFSSGALTYWKLGMIDAVLARRFVVVAVPAAAVGSLLAAVVPGDVVRTVFGLVALLVGWRVLAAPGRSRAAAPGARLAYPPGLILEGLGTTAVGGTLLGLISVGLAELQSYHFLVRARLPPDRAVATNIAVVVTAVAAAAAGHVYTLVTSSPEGTMNQVARVLLFTIPGVLIGGQLGPRAQARLGPTVIRRGVGSLLIAVGLVMLLIRTGRLS